MFYKTLRKAANKVRRPHPEKLPVKDMGAMTVFVGAISALLLVAGYVIYRLASERAYHEKWKDYNDCGWA